MPETQTVLQQAQIGLEATAGVAPAGGSNKLLTGLMLHIDPDFAHTEYAAAGQRFDSVSVPSMEKSKISGNGPMTYTEIVYPHSGVHGPATITTPAGGINARKWVTAPPITGAIAGSTFQIQQGSTARARQINYGTFTDLSIAATRKDAKITVNGFGQQMQDGITLTASPTAVPLVPVQPRDWNVYLDTSSVNIGQTKLTRCFAANFGYTAAYNDIWPMDRAQASFAATVNSKPSLAVDLSLMADTTWTNLWLEARAAQKLYLRYEAISGLLVDNYQTMTITGTPTGGTFTLSYKGQTTAGIAYNATNAAVQSALVALSTIGTGNVTVTGGPGPATAWVVTMAGALANDATAMTTSGAGLTGGVSPASAVVATNIPYSYVLDACVIPVPDAYGDDNGAWVQKLALVTVGDPNWTVGNPSGTAVMFTAVNNLASL